MADQDELAGRVSPPATAKAEKTSPKAPEDIDALVNGWFMEWFPTSIIARFDESWQLLHRAVSNLKQRLKGEDHG
jgi:hypothetical protein